MLFPKPRRRFVWQGDIEPIAIEIEIETIDSCTFSMVTMASLLSSTLPNSHIFELKSLSEAGQFQKKYIFLLIKL
jgi:hypothetical protein